MNSTKRYILKPGRHQFAPGSAATHHNNNLSDEEAEWYLEKYPHIASLFDNIPQTTYPACRVSDEEQSVGSPIKSEQSQQHENLPSTN
jgi:hypothetical protein